MSVATFRFAPSPNGELHLGHAFSALFTARSARSAAGRFLLRIEDIDTTRCRETFVRQIYEDLAWLGLTWEEPVRRQSAELETYRTAQQALQALGLLYPCFCTRRDIAAAATGGVDPDGAPLYPGTCRTLAPSERLARVAQGEPHSLRLDMRAARTGIDDPLSFIDLGRGETVAADPLRWGDAIVVRKDIGTSYHVAVVIDDALQGITHVTRGMDLFEATHLHRLLQHLLGLPTPLYHHHRLIGDEEGRKLSKSAGGRSLRSLREAGATPDEIRTAFGFDYR
jgi:glutamyl-Q tRNA(Asp) synthetase